MLGLLLAAQAWGGGCAPAVPDEARPRNLVWISLDTLRADRLGCYGYERPTSPAVDAFAAGGVLFEDAAAPSPWTKPSHASLFTGLYPSRNGVVSFRHPLSERVDTMAEWLAARGFATAAVVSNSALTLHGLDRGFAHFEFTERGRGPEPSDVTPRALRWLAERDPDAPFFLLVHYNDLHARYRSLPEYEERFVEPYDGEARGRAAEFFRHATGARPLDEEDARHLSNLYDAALRQLDDQLAPLFDHLRASGLLEDTLVVLTSDHGEEFLEHGGLQHGLTQYQESVHVPLVLRGPGLPAARRVSAVASLVDVMPTCLALLGVPAPHGLDGVSLRPLWSGEPAHDPERLLFFEADCAVPERANDVLERGSSRAVRDQRFKLHLDEETDAVELYDLAEDPAETRDVRALHAERAAALLLRLRAYLAGAPPELPEAGLSEEDLRRLEAMGYVRVGDD